MQATVCVVLGTRPGIVKFAPILHELERRSVPHFTVHSGQHYSPNMDAVFFAEHGLAEPDFRVGAMRPDVTPGQQTAEMLAGIERVLLDERPAVVLVGGDANTNLAGALAARKLDLIVGHVEAGLRSRDWRMPEEHNRVMIDHISDVLFVPSERAATTARQEGVQGAIHVTGSTIGEALQSALADQGEAQHAEPYLLVTLHRQENVDDRDVLSELVSAVLKMPEHLDRRAIWPVHPRTEKRLRAFGLWDALTADERITLREPVGHRQFTALLANASVVLTDSGGVQQEACILGVPCVTARPSTEWVETVDVGANAVAGTDATSVLTACDEMVNRPPAWDDPFSIPGASPAQRTVELTVELLDGFR